MKITIEQQDKLWGETGPYSQANLIIQTRILDDKVSRVFLVVEVEINPFTFEVIQKNRSKFSNDQKILQLLDYSEYRGQEFGYVSSAFEAIYNNEAVMREAQERLKYAIETIIKMHRFVIDLIEK